MASINVGDADFDALVDAAQAAQDSGDRELALKLDWLARKTNAALTNRSNPTRATGMGGQSRGVRAADVPSTLAG